MNLTRVRTLALCMLLVFCAGGASAAPLVTSAIYFTGIGCPHCARTDPVLLKNRVREADLLVVEYEIYLDSVNAPLFLAYEDLFGDVFGVPAIIAGREKGQAIVGDRPILADLEKLIERNPGNDLTLPASSVSFADIDLVALWGKPKIWFGDRVAVRKDLSSKASEAVKAFILDGTLPETCEPCTENHVALSGDAVRFREAYAYDGWVLMRD